MGETNQPNTDSKALSDVDREDVRQAVLAAARQGLYQPGMADALLADLKAIKTAS